MFPLDDEIFPRVKQPIFFINSEKFQWAGNISRMKKLDSAVIQRKMITIRYNRTITDKPSLFFLSSCLTVVFPPIAFPQRYSPPEFPRLHLPDGQLDRKANEAEGRDRPRDRHRPLQQSNTSLSAAASW